MDRFRGDWFHTNELQFSADGRSLAVWRYKLSRGKARQGGEIALYDLGGKQPHQRAIIPFAQTDIDILSGREVSFWFSLDNRTLAVSSEKMPHIIQLWDVAQTSPRLNAHLQANSGEYVAAFAFRPDGKRAASAVTSESMKGCIVHLWDRSQSPPKETATLSGPDTDVISMVFSPKGDFLATAEGAGIIRVWDVRMSKPQQVSIFTCEQILLKGNVRGPWPPRPWENLHWHTDANLEKLALPPQLTMCFGPDDKLWLAELFRHRGQGRCRLRSWELSGPAPSLNKKPVVDTYLVIPYEDTGHWSPFCLAVRPRGEVLLIVKETLKMLDPQSGRITYQCSIPGPIKAAAISPTGRYWATANGNGTVYILQLPP